MAILISPIRPKLLHLACYSYQFQDECSIGYTLGNLKEEYLKTNTNNHFNEIVRDMSCP